MIRRFRPADADAVAATLLEASDEGAVTGRGLLHLLATLPARAEPRLWVAARDDEVLGWARVQRKWSSDPSIVRLRAVVRPDARGRGLGAALWVRAEEYARSLRPRLLHSHADDDPASSAFLERRGFAPGRRTVVTALDLCTAELPSPDPPPGIRLAPLRELRDRPADLFQLYLRTEEDIPADVQYGRLTIDEWIPETLEHPDLDGDASVVALAGEQLVAFTFLSTARDRRVADNEMTGTLPAFRGRGLARLVKLDSLGRAADAGIERVFAANDAENRPMRAINRSLGYREVKVLTNYERAP